MIATGITSSMNRKDDSVGRDSLIGESTERLHKIANDMSDAIGRLRDRLAGISRATEKAVRAEGDRPPMAVPSGSPLGQTLHTAAERFDAAVVAINNIDALLDL